MIADGGGPRIEGRGMNQGDSGTANTADREIANTRIFDAPRELIWKAWTDPKHVAEWWGPNGFTNTIHEMDVRPGGVWRFTSFYKTVFGWSIRERGDGQLAFDDGVGEVSGTWVRGRKPATEPGLLIYIMVDNVAATSEAVIANGGNIVQPIGADAPEITARFSDPAGNVLGLYQEPTRS